MTVLTTTSSEAQISVLDFRPDKAFYRPEETVRLLVELQGSRVGEIELHLEVSYLTNSLQRLQQKLRLEKAGQTVETAFEIDLPSQTPAGYGFDLTIRAVENLTIIAKASTATDVLADWWQMPRYGFFANFKPEETGEESSNRAWALSAYHINVVQFYDWMYRHEDFIPPQDDFVDPMGRIVSMATVRHKIEAAHKLNMATLAYGAVYGATPAFWESHKEWGMYQADGEPYSLEKLFYLMNISENSPWYELILTQYENAISQLNFDGIHVDQYGYPKIAYTSDGSPQTLELAELFPPIIDEAARRVARLKPGAAVIFNAVNNWPIETVAATAQRAVYIEVWPPYVDYMDLQNLITGAQKLCQPNTAKKQVILAAYLTPFLPQGVRVSDNATTAEAPHTDSGLGQATFGQGVEEAQNSALLITATIYASGGFHLLLGENNGVLADPYYPHYGHFLPDFVTKMRQYYDFCVRYENILSEATVLPTAPERVEKQLELRSANSYVELSGTGKAGTVWAIMHELPDLITINLINLIGVANSRWNTFKETPVQINSLEIHLNLTIDQAENIEKIWWASPDDSGIAHELEFRRATHENNRITLIMELPHLAYWSLVVLVKREADS